MLVENPEIACLGSFRHSEHSARKRHTPALAELFIAQEDEEPVLYDRATAISAKLVSHKLRLGLQSGRIGVVCASKKSFANKLVELRPYSALKVELSILNSSY